MSFGGGPKCGACDKTVYFNEKVDACGKAWHKLCFKCFDCSKMLDSGSVSDKRDGGRLIVATSANSIFGLICIFKLQPVLDYSTSTFQDCTAHLLVK